MVDCLNVMSCPLTNFHPRTKTQHLQIEADHNRRQLTHKNIISFIDKNNCIENVPFPNKN